MSRIQYAIALGFRCWTNYHVLGLAEKKWISWILFFRHADHPIGKTFFFMDAISFHTMKIIFVLLKAFSLEILTQAHSNKDVFCIVFIFSWWVHSWKRLFVVLMVLFPCQVSLGSQKALGRAWVWSVERTNCWKEGRI